MPICPKCHQKGSPVGARCDNDDYHFVDEEAFSQGSNDPFLGTRLDGRYVITDRLARGGMGAIYRALQMPVHRQVAVKVLHTEVERSSSGRERFVREARAVSQLTHPNVITLHDFGFDAADRPFMVMEYAAGRSAADWLYSSAVTTNQLIHVTRQILSALADAHNQGIVHRDLKPDNVIITTAGPDDHFVKLLDFGLVRLIDRESMVGLTRDGEVFGTPHYMSPEQARSQGKIGPPSDVYSMGIMMYEFFCARLPFDADRPLQVLFKHLEDPLPDPQPRPGIVLPEPIRDVIVRATRKDPDRRFADAAAMLQALEQAVDDTETELSGRARRSPTPTPHRTAAISTSDLDGTDSPPDHESSEDIARVPTLAMAGVDTPSVPPDSDVGGNTYKAWEFDDDTSPSAAARADDSPTDETPRRSLDRQTTTRRPLMVAAVAAAVVVTAAALALLWSPGDDPVEQGDRSAPEQSAGLADDDGDTDDNAVAPARQIAADVETTAVDRASDSGESATSSSDGGAETGDEPAPEPPPQVHPPAEEQPDEEPPSAHEPVEPADPAAEGDPADSTPNEVVSEKAEAETEPDEPVDVVDDTQPADPSPFQRRTDEEQPDDQPDGPAPFERAGGD